MQKISKEIISKNIELNKLRLAFEQTPGAIFILDKNFRFEYVNPGFEKLSGYTKDELLNKTVADLFYGEEVRESRKEVVESMLKGEKWQGELLTHNKKGNHYWANTVASPYKDENNNIEGYIIVQQDITDRKRIETALRESEQKYRELTEMLPLAVYELDANGVPTYINKAGKALFGIDLAKKAQVATSFFIKEDLARMKNALMLESSNLLIENESIDPIPSDAAEYTAIRNDGTDFPVLIYGTAIVEDNKVIGSRGIIVDISERKAMENALRKSEQKYRELSEMLPQTVYELDLKANLMYLNKAGREKFGTAYETSEVSVFSIVIPEELERMRKNFNNVSFANIPSKGNFYKLQQVDGHVFEAMISATPMKMNGKTVGSRGVVIDISDHVAMQKALAESEEKYRSVIENATDGIVITQNGKLKFLNKTMCEMMQYEESEILGTSYYDMVVPEDHQIMVEFHKRRMAGENFTSLYRSRFIRKDGKIITVELNTRTSDYNGNPAAFIIIRDISDRIKIENELQIAKTKLEKLNNQLEKRVKESSESLTEARTQLINLQKENLQSQFDVLKQQVNPHFLFNSLNVLTSLIKLEPNLAEKFSEQLSKVYRYVLENKDNELVDLQTELNFLDAYIFLLNIRFVNKLKVNINIPEARRNDQIIPLAMQLLIENAIKHNTMSKSEPLQINIFIDENNMLNIVNNLQERPSQLASTGVGLKNILNRYQLLGITEPVFRKTTSEFIAQVPLVITDSNVLNS